MAIESGTHPTALSFAGSRFYGPFRLVANEGEDGADASRPGATGTAVTSCRYLDKI